MLSVPQGDVGPWMEMCPAATVCFTTIHSNILAVVKTTYVVILDFLLAVKLFLSVYLD